MGIKAQLNKAFKKDYKDEGIKREKEMGFIASRVLKIVVDNQLPMGRLTEADEKEYQEAALAVIEFMFKNNVKYVDKDFVFQLALQPIDKIKEIVLNSLARSFDMVINKSLSKEFREVTLGDMDKILKSNVIIEEVKKT